MPRSDATRPRSSEAAAIISRPGYQGMLYIALLRNNTAVSNLFLLLSTRKKKQWENMEKKMKQKKYVKLKRISNSHCIWTLTLSFYPILVVHWINIKEWQTKYVNIILAKFSGSFNKIFSSFA